MKVEPYVLNPETFLNDFHFKLGNTGTIKCNFRDLFERKYYMIEHR